MRERGQSEKKTHTKTLANSVPPSPNIVQTNKCTKFVTSSTPTLWYSAQNMNVNMKFRVDMKILDKITVW